MRGLRNPLAAALATALLAAAGASGCSLLTPRLTRPSITVASVEMRSGNFVQQRFAVKLNVQNPNDRPLPVHGVHVELNVEGDRVASGVSDRSFVVPAFGESEFDMTIEANLALGILKLAQRMDQHAQAIDYDVTGGASLDLPFMRELPFHQGGSVSLSSLN